MEIVNGFVCRTCCDVDLAKKNIDPAHPKDGPNGRDSDEAKAKRAEETAVRFGGNLAFLNDPARVNATGSAEATTGTARQALPRLDLRA